MDAAPAKAAGLIEFGDGVRFRHPLVRSAAYRQADPADVRAVHHALSRATDPELAPDRRAWHAAQACSGPDEEVAAALERSAERARRRGGMAAEAVLLERAAALTPDPARLGRRALAAAEAQLSAASLDAASELAATAATCPLGPLDQARLTRLRARVLFARSRSDEAAPLLLEAARQLEAEDPSLARETYLEAISATVFSGRVHGPRGAQDAAYAVRRMGLPSSAAAPSDLLLEGVATLLAEGLEDGVPALRRALVPFVEEVPRGREATMRWLMLTPVAQETYVHQLWDMAAWEALSTRAVRLARDVGALGLLPEALMFSAGVQLHRGEFTTAAGMIDEGLTITTATGSAPFTYAALVLAAWRGDEAAAMPVLDRARESAHEHGEASLIGLSGYAKGVLYNGLARYGEAMAGARQGVDHDGFNFTGWSLVEHVEAASRCGEADQAAESLARLAERTAAAGTDWAHGIHARSQALLTDGQEADGLYRTALDQLSRERIAIQVARTHLVYGEWLRRSRRRAQARDHLRRAHQMFSDMGAHAFAARTRRELNATGEQVRANDSGAGASLTAQESQIAGLAAAGMTNPEIGAELFLSPHTVEWHLRKVYSKLGVSSRRQLPAASRPSQDRRPPGRPTDGARVESQVSTRVTGFHRGGRDRPPAGSRERLDPLVALAPTGRSHRNEKRGCPMKVVIIGGSGLIGSKVSERLAAHGHEAVPASLQSGVNTITKEGLDDALAGADVVVDVSNSPSFADDDVMQFFTTSTNNLIEAEKAAGVKHHVALSIVGCDRAPDSGYLRAKVAQEQLIIGSGVPYSIVRSTQFFEFGERIADAATDGDRVHMAHVGFQPIASDDVAALVGRTSVGSPVNGITEIGGPERFSFDEFIASALERAGDPRTVVVDPQAPYFGQVLADDTLVPGPDAELGPTHYKQWADAQMP